MKYILVQSKEGTWYSIPEELKDTWDRLCNKPDHVYYDAWDQFKNYEVSVTITN